MISSAMPSQNQSWSFFSLRSVKGRTAIERWSACAALDRASGPSSSASA
jgi:hypothetical protein